jgi:hypothetical protein
VIPRSPGVGTGIEYRMGAAEERRRHRSRGCAVQESGVRHKAAIAVEIDLTLDVSVSVVPQVRAGWLKALAVGGPRPFDVLPGVAPIAHTYLGFDADGWEGVFVLANRKPNGLAPCESFRVLCMGPDCRVSQRPIDCAPLTLSARLSNVHRGSSPACAALVHRVEQRVKLCLRAWRPVAP